MVLPPGVGFKLPAGAELVWQVHYTPTGKVEKDQSEVGLILCHEKPERQLRQRGAFNFKFEIPPHAENERVTSSTTFESDTELISLMPHMHLRGKAFKYTAVYPDKRREVLLSVPDYDFNWQHRYIFEEPKFLPKGTIVECEARFDNSAENPRIPIHQKR